MRCLYNNAFKSDSQRVAFLLCVAFSFKVVCGSFGIALFTYMVSLCFASQQFDQKCRLTTIYTAC
ncbi:hypothetical protein C0W80_12520 [Photobacterium leiognathi subsp. mandapamensis]|nr:hypothetical protein C0W80_12520 [Photobacterium leiognathi subsp. mandapamensis]